MSTFLLYLATGAVAGTLAGLLGIGGGIIMVVALLYLLPLQGVEDIVLTQAAVGTSLACISATAIASAAAHHRHGGVLWPVFARLAPGLLGGALIGAWLADLLPSIVLQRIIGAAALVIAVRMLAAVVPAPHRQLPGAVGLAGAGGVIGSISALIGIGGGSLTVPFLNWCNVSMQKAVGTSAACGMPIAWAGVAGFIFVGWDEVGTGPWSLGYVSLPAFAGIAIASVLCAPLGARLAHSLPAKTLKRIFGVLLVVVGIKLLFG